MPTLVQANPSGVSLNGVTRGNCLAMAIGSTFQGLGIAITDNLNGLWQLPVVSSAHFVTAQIFVFPSTAGGNVTASVVINPTGKPYWTTLMEFTGVVGVAAVDQAVPGNGFGSTSESVGPTPPLSYPSEAAIAIFQSNASQTWTAAGGYTLLSPATQQMACEYLITSSIAAQTATMTTLANATYDAAIVTLLPAPKPFKSSFFSVRP